MNRWGRTATEADIAAGIAEARQRVAKITGGYRHAWQIEDEHGRFPCRSGVACTATVSRSGKHCPACVGKMGGPLGIATTTPCRAKCGGTVHSTLKYPLCEACRKASKEAGPKVKKGRKKRAEFCVGCGNKFLSATGSIPLCGDCRQRRPPEVMQAEREKWEQERAA